MKIYRTPIHLSRDLEGTNLPHNENCHLHIWRAKHILLLCLLLGIGSPDFGSGRRGETNVTMVRSPRKTS